MYECPNCAGNLQFDIASQQLLCAHCDTKVDPYSFYKEKDAEEAAEYEVTVFTCPQCGGRLISEDTTAATFCSFCGSATILDSRISKERRPVHIIPFSRTKEDCRSAYAKMMRRAIFAPKELKDKANIEKFRGIYMPYWIYSFEKQGPITFSGSKSHQRGDYLITKHYKLSSQVESSYQGIAYDASASFSDNLSGAIAPYDLSREQPFAPAFLSGFYADTSDVDDWVYKSEAQDVVLEDSVKNVSKSRVCSRYHAGSHGNKWSLRNALQPDKAEAELAMFPVWFLSYRKGDRVAYAVVNGQTGKAAADLPVDPKKYLAGSLLLAVPLFLLLNRFFTMIPGILLGIAALLALLCMIVSSNQISRILEKEAWEDDRGRAFKENKNAGWTNYASQGSNRSRRTSTGRIFLLIVPILLSSLLPVFLLWEIFRGGSGLVTGTIFALAVACILFRKFVGKLFQHFKEKWRVLSKPLAAMIIALIILLLQPVSDLYYYGGAILVLATVVWSFMDIIRQHNMLTTRKLPQFNRRGGDGIA